MLEATPEIYRGLKYPFGRKPDIRPGKPVEVAPGVFWARFAMPMSLDHINLWLLEDGDGWTIVDTCLDIPSTRETWETIFADFMGGRPVTRVICTHLHPDHVGAAGWLTARFDCDLWMSREEFLMCKALTADTGRPAPEVALRFYRRAGWTEDQLEVYKQRFGQFGQYVSPLPDSFHRLADQETITIGGNYWQLLVGRGHSPEHVSLYCPALKLLISGDQVLPRITPNVSVFPTEPEGDPLREWLASNAAFRDSLPGDLLVLPAHEAPFFGLHHRLGQVIESHNRDLRELFDFLGEPKRVVDCFPALFKRRIDDTLIGAATGETLAHLNCLLRRRRITRRSDERGVYWYRKIAATAEADD